MYILDKERNKLRQGDYLKTKLRIGLIQEKVYYYIKEIKETFIGANKLKKIRVTFVCLEDGKDRFGTYFIGEMIDNVYRINKEEAILEEI